MADIVKFTAQELQAACWVYTQYRAGRFAVYDQASGKLLARPLGEEAAQRIVYALDAARGVPTAQLQRGFTARINQVEDRLRNLPVEQATVSFDQIIATMQEMHDGIAAAAGAAPGADLEDARG